MKRSQLALSLACIMFANRQVWADATLAGVFLSGKGQGLAAGKIALTVKEGQVSFQVTLFQQFATNGPLQAALEVAGKSHPFTLGTGTRGKWPIGDFLGPAPGATPAPAPAPVPKLEQMPSIPPPNSEGMRFTGPFAAFPGLEHLILAQGGKVNLKVGGAVPSIENPLFSATLMNVAPPPAPAARPKREHKP